MFYCTVMLLTGYTTISDGYNFTRNETENTTLPVEHVSAIFLQTAAAQGIAGVFAVASLLLTFYHVTIFSTVVALQIILFSVNVNSQHCRLPVSSWKVFFHHRHHHQMRSDQSKHFDVAIVRQNGLFSASSRASVAVTPVSADLVDPCGGWTTAGASPLLRRPVTIPHLGTDSEDLVCRCITDRRDPIFIYGLCGRHRTGQSNAKLHR